MSVIQCKVVEYDYDPETHTLRVIGTDDAQAIVTVELKGVYPKQLIADIEEAARSGKSLFEAA